MLFTDKAWILFDIMSSIVQRICDYTMDIRGEVSRNFTIRRRFTVGVKSVLLAVCWQMNCYIVNRV